MAKYIDADAAIKAICGEYPKEQLCNGKAEAVAILEAMPAADVEPVKRGKWERIPLNVSNDDYGMNKYNLRIKCSYCGFVTAAEFRYMTHCHCCGAKMEGATE